MHEQNLTQGVLSEKSQSRHHIRLGSTERQDCKEFPFNAKMTF